MTFDMFLDHLSQNQKENILYWDKEFLDYPNINRKMRYSIPFYYYHSWVCYLNPIKKTDNVELVFIHGQKLEDEYGILDPRNRKMVAGIMLDDINADRAALIHELFSQATMLDEGLKKK